MKSESKSGAENAEHNLAPFVIGTAGHVDHGKSTLVQRLTGIDPDRLAEEKSRQMTIDLGFAWLDLPSKRRVGIVDVPGHERFVRNMLAGVGGIDAALVVIAADDGPMPQTREHLAILDILEVERGIVVITKTDLVEEDWLEIVLEEATELISETSLVGSPIVPVSAVTGEGIDALIEAIELQVNSSDQRPHTELARMPIDRVFTVQGFGTIATGTVIGGTFTIGQDVMVMPQLKPARIRGIEIHGQQQESVGSGSRAAINLSGVEKQELSRGDTLTTRGGMTASLRLDGHVRLLESAAKPLRQNDEVDLYLGSSETPCRATLLDTQLIAPGDSGWVQFRMSKPVAALKNDRFVLRRLSPAETIGGGMVVDASPSRHKRFQPAIITALEIRAAGTLEDLLLVELMNGPVTERDVKKMLGQEHSVESIDEALTRFEGASQALRVGNLTRQDHQLWIATTRWNEIRQSIETILSEFHIEFPNKAGIPREELRSRSRLEASAFDVLLATGTSTSLWLEEGAVVRLPKFDIALSEAERKMADAYLSALRLAGNSPPVPDLKEITPETLSALVARNELVRVASGIYFEPAMLAQIEQRVLELIDAQGSISLSQFRDEFTTSRKYAQAILEYFDRQRVTRRIGDNRRQFKSASSARDTL